MGVRAAFGAELSPIEIACIELLEPCEGRAVLIAARLHLTHSCVINHLSRAYRKLGVHSMVRAALWWERTGRVQQERIRAAGVALREAMEG